MTDFKCKDCEEEFEHEIMCKIHHMHTKHQNFELVATDKTMVIKS